MGVLVEHVQHGPVLGFQGRRAGDLDQLGRLREAGGGDLLHGRGHTLA